MKVGQVPARAKLQACALQGEQFMNAPEDAHRDDHQV
jgi:hypothetical protein